MVTVNRSKVYIYKGVSNKDKLKLVSKGSPLKGMNSYKQVRKGD